MLATSDSVHAKDALAPLTGVTDRRDHYNRDDSDNVHAKDALAPLTQMPAGDQGHTDPVHARQALAPLTEVPAEGKGIVETVMEYLPGHGHAAHEVHITFLQDCVHGGLL